MEDDILFQNIYYDETSPTCLRWKVTQKLPDGRKTRCVKDSVVGCRSARSFYFQHKRYSISKVVLLLNGVNYSEATHSFKYIDGDKTNHKVENICCFPRKDLVLKTKSEEYKVRIKTNTKNTNERKLLTSARERSRRYGIECSIELSDIKIPNICPILGIPLQKGKGAPTANSPTLDRKDPKKGYIKDNVQVISMKANTMKSNADTEELIKFANWVLNEYNRTV